MEMQRGTGRETGQDSQKMAAQKTSESHEACLASFLEKLRAAGVADAGILSAFAAVPRHLFVDSWFEHSPAGWVLRHAEGERSLAAIYSNRALVLDVKDGLPVSSTSQPSLIGSVLRALDVRPGMNILEIGCGVGYSTALLSRLVGSEGQVTAVDVDARLVERAREVHRRLGFPTRFASGDGYNGFKEAAPFDRIVVYTGLADVSPVWLQQLGESGFVLAPIDHCVDTPYLRIRPDGTGAAVMWAGFIPARGQLGWSKSRPSPWSGVRLPAVGTVPVLEETWQVDSRSFWFFLTFRERRLARLLNYSLVSNSSYVSWDDTHARAFGDAAEARSLLAEVKALVTDFEKAGAPSLTSVKVCFGQAQATTGLPCIPRLYHHETAAFG